MRGETGAAGASIRLAARRRSTRASRALLGVIILSACLGALPVPDARADTPGGWISTGSLTISRRHATATPLPNGKILVVGGVDTSGVDFSGTTFLGTAELYDPATGASTATGSLTTGGRALHTATLLPNGKVLVAGGWNGSASVSTAELYDPATGAFTAAGSMNDVRSQHTATLLPDGFVLVAGGWGTSGQLASAERYNPATGAFSTTGSMTDARNTHTATLLPTGLVMVAGGYGVSGPLLTVELFDSSSGTFTAVTSLPLARGSHTATLLPNGEVLLAGGNLSSGPTASVEVYNPVQGSHIIGSLANARQWHSAVLLPNGKVLIAGGNASASGHWDIQTGYLASAEVYDPATNVSSSAGNMGAARSMASAVALWTGEVLVAGGGTSSADLYCPAMPGTPGTWTATGSLGAARVLHTATRLPDGRVLVAGGKASTGNVAPLASTEVYDPATGLFTSAGAMTDVRDGHTATLLPNGQVLIVGGENIVDFPNYAKASAELHDPAAGTLFATGSLATARTYHTATLLPTGKVLIVGGLNFSGVVATAELYDPTGGAFAPTGSLALARYGHTATLLGNGKVLIAGGRDASSGNGFAGAELYDPATGLFTATGSMGTGRNGHTATFLPNGKVLVAGGVDGTGNYVASAEVYDPAAGTWTATGSMSAARIGGTAILLANGDVLVAGGSNGTGPLSSAELYDVVTGTFNPTAAMAGNSGQPTATPLGDGRVLATGGYDSAGTAQAAGELYSVAVCAANTPPVANPQTVTTQQNTAITITLTGTDAETATGNLTYSVVTGPLHGSLSPGTGQARLYTPTAGYAGPDSFTFTVTDGGSPDGCAGPACAAPLTSLEATVTINVTATGTISGAVTQGAGGPSPGSVIAGALVIVRNSDNGYEVARSYTDGSGNYAISGLQPRNYKVSAEANGFAIRYYNNQTSFSAGGLVAVTAGAITGGINFALPGGAGSISGRVTLADGVTPVANASISIKQAGSGNGVLWSTTSNANGDYNTQRRLAAGTGSYVVRVTAAGFPATYYVAARSVATATPVTVNADADTTGIDVRLSPGVGGISGQVASAATGAPLASVGVSVWDAATNGFVQGFTTDATGHYDTGHVLAPGQYKVTAAVAGSETIAYNNKFSVATGDPVTVADGVTTTGIDLALPLLGGITGHVRNAADNTPLASATVNVYDYATGAFVTSATTAASGDVGSYTISNLNPLQAYRVQARLANFGLVFYNGKPSAGQADVVTVPAGATTTLDFALGAAGGIMGTVTDAGTGLPIQGVSIDLIDGASTNFSINNFINFGVTTDAFGNFNTGRVLAPGLYKVRARKFNSGYIQTFHLNGRDLSTATPVTVTAGADTSGVGIAMPMGGTITGTIRDRASNAPISGASVAAQRFASSNFFADNFVTTDANGNYTITGLHPGEWLVMAVATGHMLGYYSGDPNNLATDFGSSLTVQITGTNTVSNVNLNLPLGGGEVRGRVTRLDNGQPVLPGTGISIRGPWPRTSSVWNFAGGPSGGPAFTLFTNAQGDYAFSGLPPGRYIIEANRFQVPNGTAIGFFPTGAISRATGVPVAITDGGVATADFQVVGFSGGATPRSISGTLKDTSNNPIRDAFVFVYEPTGLSFIRGLGVFDDGSFVVDGLPPGRYLLNANAEQTFVSTNHPAELTLETAALVDATAGDVAGINLVAPDNAGTITGTVTRSDTGQVLLGASISVRTFLGGAVVGGTSRADGTYLVRGVAPGFYKVSVSAPGFVTKFFNASLAGGVLTLEDGSFVDVSAGTNTPDINVTLDPTDSVLTGTVKREGTLEPVIATVVGIRDATTGNRVTTVVTDATGTWRSESLGPGSYKVQVADFHEARHATQWYSGHGTLLDADPVTVASETSGIDFLVSADRGSISGQVLLNAGGTPLPNAGVEILDAATGGYVRRALTGSDGRYSAPGLAPGANLYVAHALALGVDDQYYLGATTRPAATPLTVANLADTPNIDFSLTVSSTADLAVTQFANPSPVLSGGSLTYTIKVLNSGPSAADNLVLTDAIPSGTTFQSLSPSDGCATPAVGGTGIVSCWLGSLAPGASVTLILVVNVTAPSGSVVNTASVASTTSDPTLANNSATSTVNITTPGSISGTVCSGAAPPCGGGNPAIIGALIVVRNSDSGFEVATTLTDGSGNYTVNGLYPRNYKVSAEANGFATRYYNNQTNITSAALVAVNPSATTPNVNFGLPANAGGIKGQVTLVDGVTPVPNAEISVRTTAGDLVLSASTDALGNYDTQRRLAAGNYLVRVTATGFAVTYFVSARSIATATPVAVPANGDKTGVDVKLETVGGGISGTIRSAATGAPLASVAVSVYDGVSSGFVQGFTTDAAGRYDTGHVLAPGSYKVISVVAGSEAIAWDNKFSVATGDPVTVSGATTTPDIDIALPLLGGITGHVTNAANSSPIAGAIVDVWDYGSNSFLRSTATAADGSYTISGLNPLQAYRVRARAANFGMVFYNGKPSAGQADTVSIPTGANATLDFALVAAGGIKGTITDAATAAPISCAAPANPCPSIDIIDGASTNLSINNFINFAVAADPASGNFDTGRVLAPGVYKVRVRKPAPNPGYIQTFYPNGRDLSTAATVTVTANADTIGVNIAMPMGGTITGTIRDRASGLAISGASVAATRVYSSSFFGDFTVTTNASGVFTLTGLHPGEWLIYAQAPGRILGWYSGDANSPATDFSTALPIQITGSNTVSAVDLSLATGGGEIRGRVTRQDNGQPVPVGAGVTLRGPWPRTTTITQIRSLTNAQGDYSLPGLAPGRYIVEIDRFQTANGTAIGFFPFGAISRATGVPVTVADGGVVTADFQVLGFSGGASPRAIKGTLKDQSNQPIREALVYALEPTGLTAVRYVGTFDDGSFVLDGLAPGRYLVSTLTEKTFVFGTYPSEITVGAGSVVDVTAADAAGIDLVLPDNAGTITGTITRSDTGQPVMGASISVRTFLDISRPGGTSRVDGGYLARGIAPGTYKVRVSAPGFVTKFFVVGVPGGARTLDEGSFVEVTGGTNTPNINVALDPTGGALTGTVRREGTLEPVVATVTQIYDAASGSRVLGAVTDASGTWRTEGLGPGEYSVEILDGLEARHATQWYSGKGTSLSADPVTVAAVGTTGGIDVLVSPNRGSISGQVFRSDGPPLRGAGIRVLDAATGGHVRRFETNSSGFWQVTGLAPGDNQYVVQTRTLGFADQFYAGVPTRVAGTPVSVTNGGDTPGINFNLTLSSNITGTVSYGGPQVGALRVRLFSDPGLTQQAYETVVASPAFPQAYGFALPAPDTRGLLPGTYYISAFLDSNGNGFQDATEASGQLGGSVVLGENATLAGRDVTLADPPATTNTPPAADAQTVIFVQGTSNNSIILTGLDAQTATANLAYLVTTNPLHGTLATTLNPQQRLYTPNPGFTGTDTFTFTVTDRGDPDGCGAPAPSCAAALTSAPATVTIQVTPNTGTTSLALANPAIPAPSEGSAIGNVEIDENATGALQAASAIKLSLPAGLTYRGTPTVSLKVGNGAVLNPPILESPGVLSFTLALASTTGPASILVSAISIDVPPGFLPEGVTSAAVLTTVSGPNPGLTPASVQNATLVAPAAGPTLTEVAPARAAQGAVGRVVTLAGANFATDATVSFGAGVTAFVTVDSATQITAIVNVDAFAALGPRDVTVTNVSAAQSATLPGAFEITAPPTVTGFSAGFGSELTQNLVGQLVTITGTNFQPPTKSPPDIVVALSPGAGLTVHDVAYTNSTTITAIVDVGPDAPLGPRDVTVTNPDGGQATGFGLASVVAPTPEQPTGLSAPPSSKSSQPPPAPTISSLTPNAGPLGGPITINGSGFSSTASSNSVTFAGTGGTRVAATVQQATTGSLVVTVPPQATTGNVTVAVGGVLSNAVTFTVTSPVLSAVLPNSGTQGTIAPLTLTLSGIRFLAGASVSFGGSGDIVIASGPAVSPDGTSIQVSVNIAQDAQLGLRDVTVTNPGGGGASTLPGAFEVKAPVTAGFEITLPAFADISTYVPSVGDVSVTRDATGRCAAKSVTPTAVQLQAQFVTSANLAPPASVTFTLVSSAIAGTATNEDCELDPLNPTKDFSIGAEDPGSQQVVVAETAPGTGLYLTMLHAHDWGGKVTITVTGTTIDGTTARGDRTLPVDTDGDDLPDAYEKNVALNADKNGVNVLNFLNPDQNGNAVKDRDDRFARDGLSNFEKYRGVYVVGPIAGGAGLVSGFERLGAGYRHLFVRGRGFRDDPAITAGFCGINFTTGAPVADATLSATNPCPAFQVGPAFQRIGVMVHNVSASFTAGTELPRKSFTNTAAATLDMATVVYDATACSGSEACDTTSKFGARQWQFPTLGFSNYGTATAYGASIKVFKRAIEAYFKNRPYQHRTNDPARVVTAPDGTPMLAPITRVGDSSGSGADNGLIDRGDATVSGQLAGDTYIAGSFTQQLTALDVNTDGCIELPAVPDPTTIPRCAPDADSAAYPSATKQQVGRGVTTHELAHGVGVNIHTTDATDIMYQYTINWIRDGNFSSSAASLIQIHNKGLQ